MKRLIALSILIVASAAGAPVPTGEMVPAPGGGEPGVSRGGKN